MYRTCILLYPVSKYNIYGIIYKRLQSTLHFKRGVGRVFTLQKYKDLKVLSSCRCASTWRESYVLVKTSCSSYIVTNLLYLQNQYPSLEKAEKVSRIRRNIHLEWYPCRKYSLHSWFGGFLNHQEIECITRKICCQLLQQPKFPPTMEL